MARSTAPMLLVLEEDFLPGGAAVERAIDAAVRVGSVDVAQRRHVHTIRVRRVHHDASDLARGFEPDVGPGLARVDGFDTCRCRRSAGCGYRSRRCRRRSRWDSKGPRRWRRWSRWECPHRRWGTRCGRSFRSSRRRRRRSRSRRCRAGWRGRRRRRCVRRAWGPHRASAGRPADCRDIDPRG